MTGTEVTEACNVAWIKRRKPKQGAVAFERLNPNG